ncbi:MAG TPA: PDZ domain-containing protein [Candidatus Sulfotelmatobacter sp.]|jgi:predicted metalloprotease with PDZ domain|nr:PDZ domain-containing protein [Candidatus Sulfotelmatobacter sp.]
MHSRVAEILFGLFLATGGLSFAAEPVHYELSFEQPNTHLMDITIHTGELDGKTVRFALPYWAPGVYIAEEFAVNVQGFRATDDAGALLAWHKAEDGQTWEVDLAGRTSVVIHYQIYANGMPFRGAQYNEHHASLTGAAVWMYMVDGKNRSAELTIDRSRLPASWKIATGMQNRSLNQYGAADYDWFADCPVEISDFAEKDFTALGTNYHVVVDDQIGKKDFTQFTQDLQRIVEKGVVPILAPVVAPPLPAPFSEYWFLIHVNPGFGGVGAGVEHLTSTMIVIGSDWDDHSSTSHDSMGDLYTYKLDLVAHEFFHAWNVKRLRPRPLGPFDYSRPVHTTSLWISEGLTDYFAAIAMLRAGYYKPQDYLDLTARVITGFEQDPGRSERSIADTSWDTWFGFAGAGAGGFGPRFSNNLANTNYSYYDGGHILGLLLDLEIRHVTGNRQSLDDWLRLMYQRYALPKPGFEPEDAVRAATEVAGTDMSEFFRRYVSGKDPLPHEKDLSYAGIRVDKEYPAGGWLGVTVEDQKGRAVVANVVPGSPAEIAGLDRGDEIVAAGDKAVDARALIGILKERSAGSQVVLTVIRAGIVRSLPVTLAKNPSPTYKLRPVEHPTPEQAEIYRSMMNTR